MNHDVIDYDLSPQGHKPHNLSSKQLGKFSVETSTSVRGMNQSVELKTHIKTDDGTE